MKKKTVSKGKIIGGIILLILILFLSTFSMGFSLTGAEHKTDAYASVMKDAGIAYDTPVTKIAMLGAHDAFSEGITTKSDPNVNEGGIVNNQVVNLLGKGFSVRMSRAQKSSALDLLNAGVRYLDVRVTRIDGEYYAMHGYLSRKLVAYVQEVVYFLSNHPGEMVVFDVQHYYTENGANRMLPDEDYEALYDFLEECGLTAFVRYDALRDPLSSLTYGQVTSDGTEGGVVMLAKTDRHPAFYSRDPDASYERGDYVSIRSLFHRSNQDEELLEGIEEEYRYLQDHPAEGIFCVNQAQKTGFIMDASLVRSIFSWSLLDMANGWNRTVVSDEARFDRWLSAMPILMVDYATTDKGDFNRKANEWIIAWNKAQFNKNSNKND